MANGFFGKEKKIYRGVEIAATKMLRPALCGLFHGANGEGLPKTFPAFYLGNNADSQPSTLKTFRTG